MKFRKRAKLFPGVYINFSKSGISTTIGIPGANVNFNKQGLFLNTGIPGTGLYNRQKIGSEKVIDQKIPRDMPSEMQSDEKDSIKSEQAESITTDGLLDLKKTLLECYQERINLRKEVEKIKIKLKYDTAILILSYIIIIGFFIVWFKERKIQTAKLLSELQNQKENCFVNIDMQLDTKIEELFNQLIENYKLIISSEKIWDITSSIFIDQKSARSAASNSVTRKQVKFGFKNIDIIKSKYNALHFENANGGDLYIYPAFIAIVDSQQKFGLVDIRDLQFIFRGQRFLEEEKITNDSQVVGETWAKVNKNGTPDKRFKDNYKIPICLYGEFTLKSNTGLNEAYSISSFEKAEKFACSMDQYIMTIKQLIIVKT
jgi:hypothetical protein